MSSFLDIFVRRFGLSHVSPIVVGALALGLMGCASSGPRTRFATPGPNEPKATIRLSKYISGKAPGVSSEETIHVGPVDVTASEYAIAPGAGHVAYAGARYHFYDHYETEAYTETDSCGRRDSKGNCQSTSRSATRTVLVHTRIEDGSCEASATYAFVTGATYDVHFTQASTQTCSMTCEQLGAGPCETLSADAPLQAPATEHYEASIAHYAGYPITAVGITGVAVGLGWMIANRGDSTITDAHCPNNQCDAVGDAEVRRSQQAQLPGTVMLLGGLGATAGGLLLLNVSGRWVKNNVTVGAAGDRVVLGGTF